MTTPVARRRAPLFAVACVACLALAAGYARMSIARSRARVSDRSLAPAVEVRPPEVPQPAPAASPAVARAETVEEPSAPAAVPVTSVLMVRHTELDQSFGTVAIEETGSEGERRAGPLQCNRVYFAGDRGVCLTVDRSYATNSLIVFDGRFQVRQRLPLAGLPSRARISPDGRLAATTVFVYGHSYGDGDFSTETSIIDTRTGERVVPNLQDFDVSRGAARVSSVDFNLWGVTFAADSDRFYATLRTGGQTYLVEGTVSSRQLRILRDNVECPSLAPDQKRLVFKKRVSDDPASLWRLHVLDLATMRDEPLAESRSVDDQVEWLDDERVLYALPRAGAPAGVTDVWEARSDGTGTPAMFLSGSASPAVLRPHLESKGH